MVKRRLQGLWGLFFWHHGIYIGNGRVVHFTGESKRDKTVKVIDDSLVGFACGKRVEVHKPPYDEKHGRAVCNEAVRILNDANNGFNGRFVTKAVLVGVLGRVVLPAVTRGVIRF
jgi:hypothetical protein